MIQHTPQSQHAIADQHGAESLVPPDPLPPNEQPVRVRLRELPTPQAVVRERERRRREYDWQGRAGRQEIEDRLKLEFYYGGQTVYVLSTPQGLVVVPIPERYKDEADLRYVLLTAQERRSACLETLPPWNEPVRDSLL